MKTAKEFWIDEKCAGDTCTQLRDGICHVYSSKTDDSIHVIEKSYSDTLERNLLIAVKALEKIKFDGCMCGQEIATAKKALDLIWLNI